MHCETAQLDATGALSVLVVEDEALIAIDIEMMLEEHGFRVVGPTGSIKDALSLLEDARPDVAMLDLNVRGLPVIPVARRLRSLGVPFVIASAYDSFNFDDNGVLAGAENVGKPISEHRLIETLGRAIRSA